MNMLEISMKPKSLTKYHKYPYGGNKKTNVSEGYVMTILIFGIPCFIILFIFLQHLPNVHINMLHVS